MKAAEVHGYHEIPAPSSLPAGWRVLERVVGARVEGDRVGPGVSEWRVYLLRSPGGRWFSAPTPALTELSTMSPGFLDGWCDRAKV